MSDLGVALKLDLLTLCRQSSQYHTYISIKSIKTYGFFYIINTIYVLIVVIIIYFLRLLICTIIVIIIIIIIIVGSFSRI